MQSTKYASVRVKVETYRDLKKAAIDEGIPFTRLIDKLLALYQEREAGRLPQPRKLGGHTTRWDSKEVMEVIHKMAE